MSDYHHENRDEIGMTWIEYARWHFDNHGWKEGMDPSYVFDTSFYLEQNPDVAAAGINPLTHYLEYGVYQGRQPHDGMPSLDQFDATTYLSSNPDLTEAGVTTALGAYTHFARYGQFENREGVPYIDHHCVEGATCVSSTDEEPTPDHWSFDSIAYGPSRSDVWQHFSDNVDTITMDWGEFSKWHYDNFGWKEGSDPNFHFDTSFYLAENPDVAAAGVNPFDHFLSNGVHEGRQPHDGMIAYSNFDPVKYLVLNQDLTDAGFFWGKDLYAHFVLHGQFENRPGAPEVIPHLMEGLQVAEPAQSDLVEEPPMSQPVEAFTYMDAGQDTEGSNDVVGVLNAASAFLADAV
ncbi:MAG: hypothetical protein ROO70_00830 [Labrenzia sp.]